MSLVLEALRRVEKPDAKPGSVGVAVASYRPARRRRVAVAPLLLGLLAGGVLVFVFTPRTGREKAPGAGESPRTPSETGLNSVAAPDLPSGSGSISTQPGARPGVSSASPPPEAPRSALIEAAARERTAPGPRSERVSGRSLTPASGAGAPMPALILQAISQRDSYPIAIINDQLVKEGDLWAGVRVLRIGEESVDVLLENGRRETVRFAPPPPPESSASPDLR